MFNTADGFVPMLNKRARIVPNFQELDSATWTYSITDNKLNFVDPDVTKQSDNYRNENEQYHNNGINMYGRPTGQEPNYGYTQVDMNLFANNTFDKIKGGYDVYSQTRVLHPFVDDKYVYKQSFLYKQPDFLNDFVGNV